MQLAGVHISGDEGGGVIFAVGGPDTPQLLGLGRHGRGQGHQQFAPPRPAVTAKGRQHGRVAPHRVEQQILHRPQSHRTGADGVDIGRVKGQRAGKNVVVDKRDTRRPVVEPVVQQATVHRPQTVSQHRHAGQIGIQPRLLGSL